MTLPLITPGGFYLTWVLDYLSVCILNNILGFIFLVSTMWIYGVDHFMDFLSVAIGCRVAVWVKRIWKFYSIFLPAMFLILLTFGLIGFKKEFITDEFPKGLQIFACLMLILVAVVMVGGGVHGVFVSQGRTLGEKLR